jgi:hypothetical protein
MRERVTTGPPLMRVVALPTLVGGRRHLPGA